MKKIITILILFITMIVLTACSYNAKSIDDCKENGGKCYYSNESVRNEDSELANSLSLLLLDDNHNMSYHYKANPIDDILWIKYELDVEVSHNSFTEMVSLFDEIITLVNNLYDIQVLSLQYHT
jgi:hypothetical protein